MEGWIRRGGVSLVLGITMTCSTGESASFQLNHDSRHDKNGTAQQYGAPWLASSVRGAGHVSAALDCGFPGGAEREDRKSPRFAVTPRLTGEELSLLSGKLPVQRDARFCSMAEFNRPKHWPSHCHGRRKHWDGKPPVCVPEPATILGSVIAAGFFLVIFRGRLRGFFRREDFGEKVGIRPHSVRSGVGRAYSLRSMAVTSLLAFVMVLHMILVLREGGFGHLGVSALSWLTVGYLVWNRRGATPGEAGTLATLLGALTVVSAFAPMLVSGPEERWVRVFPFVSALGISLIAGGLRGPMGHGRELIVLFFLGVPRVVLPWLLDLSNFTAGVAAFLLHYAGQNVSLDGLRLSLDSGYVDVGGGCDGVEAITQTLALGVIFLLLVPVGVGRKSLVIAVTILAGFLSNALRVAYLAVVANPSTQGVFEFWHQGTGSMIWMVLPVVVLGCCCLWVVRRQRSASAPCGHE